MLAACWDLHLWRAVSAARRATDRGQYLSATADNATPARAPSKLPQPGFSRAWPGLRVFWSWWRNALGTWLPPRFRAVFGLAQQRLLLQHDNATLTLSLALPLQPGEYTLRELAVLPWGAETLGDSNDDTRNSTRIGPRADAGGGEPLARLLAPRINSLPRRLLLPARVGLRRRLSLPAAAADRLREVLGFEIDRQTPFTLDEVYYDARVISRRGDGQIEAELIVVPRANLESALAALGAPLQDTLSGVDMADAGGMPLGINLLPSAQRRRRRDPRAAWNAGLVVFAAVALAAGLWQVLSNREAATDKFETAVKQRSALAKKISAEKKQLVDLVEGLRFLQQTRNDRPSTVEVLDELTRRFPDNTYAEKISIEGNRILIIGLSSEAPRLVERLQGSKLWNSMNLTGALLPEPIKGKDRFTLSGDLTVAPAPGKSTSGRPRAANVVDQP